MGSAIIEVGLGLVLTYFVLSVVVTQINNLIINGLNLRAENLRAWFHRTITDDFVRYEVLAHPMINMAETQSALKRPSRLRRILNGLKRRMVGLLIPGAEQHYSTTDVSYVSPGVLTNVLVNLFIEDKEALVELSDEDKVKALIAAMKDRIEDTPLEQTLETVLATARSLQDAEAKLAAWFDNAMSNLSNLFKRRVQFISFVVGMLVSIALNVDTLHLARTLWNDPAMRETVVFAAENAARGQLVEMAQADGEASADIQRLRDTVQTFLDLRLPIGWEVNPSDQAVALGSPRNAANFSPVVNPEGWLGFLVLKLAGWLITSFAIMQGSDFWFNLLGRLTSARAAIAKAPESGQPAFGGQG
ncbi:MAG: hypothetical protein DWB42_02125 [Chloroflexi bacterium]|nr:hypothetical protein [Chloroflexota bacterium]MDL1884925.1 hypothetical protein [Anaerolineae bacterium CFX8]